MRYFYDEVEQVGCSVGDGQLVVDDTVEKSGLDMMRSK